MSVKVSPIKTINDVVMAVNLLVEIAEKQDERIKVLEAKQ